MPLPCEDLFRKLEVEKNKMDRCWKLADSRQWKLTGAGAVAAGLCSVCAAAVKAGKNATTVTACVKCTKGIADFISGLHEFSAFLDSCNQQDLRAEKAAKEFEKCAAEHKDVLNAAARANS